MVKKIAGLVAFCVFAVSAAHAEEIGSVNTAFKLIGPSHRIVVEVFDDPDITNVSCWVSRAKKGGMKGALGLAEDPANASIACRQRGPVILSEQDRQKLRKQTDEGGIKVFKQRTSAIFKTLQVTRMYDEKRNTLVYLVWSDKVVEGSRKNALSVVALAPWPEK